MNPVSLLLIGDDPATLSAVRDAVTPLLTTLELSPDRVKTLDALELVQSGEPIKTGAIAWIVLGPAFREADLYELLALAQDGHVPAALSVHDPLQPAVAGRPLPDGAVTLPFPSGEATVTAVLGALASQASAIAMMSREAELLRAHHSGMADQIGRIDEELRMAVKIQREFLPKSLPTVGPISFDVLWRPAGYVSGDIYDVIRLDEAHVGVFIADAVGHGVPAALMTIYIKQALRTKEITPGVAPGYRLLDPAETLKHLNRALLDQDGGSTCFATAIYAVLNIRTGQMKLGRGGHPLPMLLHGDGSADLLDQADGPMLGVFDTDDFETAIIDLSAGDRLLLYSDGFEMAYPDHETDDGVANEQYLEEFKALAEGTTEEAMRKFTHRLDHQTGSLNQRDDLTLLCIHADTDAGFIQAPADAEEATATARAA